jgi:hypothetical protein
MDNSVKKVQLVLTHSGSSHGIAVDLEAFFEFNFQITEELENLVDDWSHFVAGTRPANRPFLGLTPPKPR